MSKYIFLLCLLFSIVKSTIGQNKISIGNKTFPATETWEFEITDESLTESTLLVEFAKGDKGEGYLLISLKTDKSVQLTDDVILYLSFDEIMQISGPYVIDRLNGFAIAVYKVTSVQCEKLKNYKIKKLRFNLLTENSSESYTAGNSLVIYKIDKKTKMEWMLFGADTSADIKELYQ